MPINFFTNAKLVKSKVAGLKLREWRMERKFWPDMIREARALVSVYGTEALHPDLLTPQRGNRI